MRRVLFDSDVLLDVLAQRQPDDRCRVDSDKLGAVGRMAGHDYCYTHDRFTIPNGFSPEKKAAIAKTHQ